MFGSRRWRNRGRLWFAIGMFNPSTVIEGEADGADKMARQWAQFYRREVVRFPADWKRHGRRAGPIRNEQQLREGRPDRGLGASVGPKGTPLSTGTADMLRRLERAGVPTRIIRDRSEGDHPRTAESFMKSHESGDKVIAPLREAVSL